MQRSAGVFTFMFQRYIDEQRRSRRPL